MNIQFRAFTEDFLPYSWKWLTNPEIKFLTNTPDFSKETQLAWFNSLSSKSDYLIFGITYGTEPIGVCGLKNITSTDGEYWGYIGEKRFWGKGIGKLMIKKIIDVALTKNLESVWLTVIKENSRAIELYIKSGFSLESEKSGQIVMRLLLDKI